MTATKLRPPLPAFRHPLRFWLSVAACTVGVLLHLPMYLHARSTGYRLTGMAPDPAMLSGMALILLGLLVALWSLIPDGSSEIHERAAGLRIRALDEAPIRWTHIALILVMALAVTIDVMKPTTLSFIAPGVAHEYGLKSPANPGGSVPISWLPLCGISGTVIGSVLWGWLGDRIGRRASILYAGLLFISTSICGAMPGFAWNLLMCSIMGLAAGGLLPIAFALISETIPARHRGWVVVLVGGDIAGAYVITSWLAGTLTPTYSWRIMWLIGLPTGLLLLVLNHWIPESPRYLLARGHVDAAEAVMRRYGAVADRAQVETARAATLSRLRYRSLLRAPLTGRTLGVVSVAVAVGLLTYGFQFWIPTDLQQHGMSAVTSDYVLRDSALFGLPVTAVTALLYGFWSSRGTIILLAAVTGVSVLAFAWISSGPVTSHRVLVIALVLPLSGISSLAAVITAYSSEVYPTMLRSRGTGLAAGMTKAGGVLILVALVGAAWTPSLTSAAVIGAVPLLLAAAVFTRMGKETRQLSLEQIAPVSVAAGAEPDPAVSGR